MKRSLILLVVSTALIACGQQHGTAPAVPDAVPTVAHTTLGKEVTGDGQLTEYVRRIFQDSKGRYWFGSNGDGIYRYDPVAKAGAGLLEVFHTPDGLAGGQVTGILEDRNGHIWISTDGGVSRYDPSTELGTGSQTFTNFTTKDGLSSNRCWSIFEARDGTIWVGTAAGPCRFDGKAFIPLFLLASNGQDTLAYWVACITQDRTGDLWFATREAGAFRYDGRSKPRPVITKGLDDDELACILVDSKNGMWTSSMNAGLIRRDPSTELRADSNSVLRFSAPNEIGDNEVWTVFEDRDGNIWFPSEGYGVYRYDGSSLKNYSTKQGLGVLAVQTIHQDREGRMWFGGGGGLYRLDGDSMVHVERNGPWR